MLLPVLSALSFFVWLGVVEAARERVRRAAQARHERLQERRSKLTAMHSNNTPITEKWLENWVG
jgi:hypothetical protein